MKLTHTPLTKSFLKQTKDINKWLTANQVVLQDYYDGKSLLQLRAMSIEHIEDSIPFIIKNLNDLAPSGDISDAFKTINTQVELPYDKIIIEISNKGADNIVLARSYKGSPYYSFLFATSLKGENVWTFLNSVTYVAKKTIISEYDLDVVSFDGYSIPFKEGKPLEPVRFSELERRDPDSANLIMMAMCAVGGLVIRLNNAKTGKQTKKLNSQLLNVIPYDTDKVLHIDQQSQVSCGTYANHEHTVQNSDHNNTYSKKREHHSRGYYKTMRKSGKTFWVRSCVKCKGVIGKITNTYEPT